MPKNERKYMEPWINITSLHTTKERFYCWQFLWLIPTQGNSAFLPLSWKVKLEQKKIQTFHHLLYLIRVFKAYLFLNEFMSLPLIVDEPWMSQQTQS